MATLRESFPRHFKKCLGLDVPGAWEKPVTDLIVFVDALCKQDAYEHEFHWLQIKEKFDSLRAYYEYHGPYETHKLIEDAIALAEKKCDDIEILARAAYDTKYNTNT